MKNVLIVEDHPYAMDMLKTLIQTVFCSAELRLASDICAALKHLELFHFDLALIDLSLPDGSGVDVIRQLNRNSPSTCIVVCSIYGDDGHLFPALQAGAHGYLLKDDAPESLARELAGIIEGTPPLSPAIARRLIQHFNLNKQNTTNAPLPALSPREREALSLLAQGISVKQLAQSMRISPHTAADHVKAIYRKLNISSRAEAALKATELGLHQR